MHFFSAVLVFLSMATLTKHRILQCESYFSIFRVFVFFLKKTSKNDPKMQRAILHHKITKERSPGTYSGSKNEPELTSERPKKPRIDKKTAKFEG